MDPRLKVVLKGIDKLDENNLKDSKIDFEFVAAKGNKNEKLL